MDDFTPNSGDRPRTTWTPSMNRFFIDLVVDQVRRGNMIDHALRKQVWAHITALFNEKFGFQYDKDVLKNRYKSLRRKYNEITTLLNNGFQWDETRQMVIADDNIWDKYIKGHPDARSYRTKITPYYSDLCMIYGNALPDEKYTNLDHHEDLEVEDDSSRTKSGEVSGEAHAIQGDSADDAPNSSHSGEDMEQRSTQEGTEHEVREVEDTDPSAALINSNKESENLFPVEVVFALEATPSILHNSDGYRSRVSWTPPMDRYFIDLMIDHVNQGNKIGRTFSKEAWMHMIALFSEKFGSQYDKDVLYNRFKTLRKQYITIRSLLAHGGFQWDETLQMVTADVHVWDEYIKEHPDVRQYRVRPVPYFKDLCTIYTDTTPGGRTSRLNHTTPTDHRDPTNNCQEESSHLSGELDILNQLNKRLFTSPLVFDNSKKSRRNIDEGMVDALREMVTAVTSLAQKKNEDDDAISIENVIDALQALPDLDEDLFLDACDFLEDEKKAKTFLVLDERLRKKWLMRKLRPLLE